VFEKYEAFFTMELKPFIDHSYRTQAEASHTCVMGSSMGGACSMALAWDHPELFGGAASLSGAFAPLFSGFLSDVLRNYHGPPKPFRAYLDSGVVDVGGGDDGRSFTGQVVSELHRIGWRAKDLLWFVDDKPLAEAELERSGLPPSKRAEAQVSQHNEFYWRRRFWRALTFLFPASNK
jgi:S-formylglutathione hydrolase FrmB